MKQLSDNKARKQNPQKFWVIQQGQKFYATFNHTSILKVTGRDHVHMIQFSLRASKNYCKMKNTKWNFSAAFFYLFIFLCIGPLESQLHT